MILSVFSPDSFSQRDWAVFAVSLAPVCIMRIMCILRIMNFLFYCLVLM